jgi:hypothetical protein
MNRWPRFARWIGYGCILIGLAWAPLSARTQEQSTPPAQATSPSQQAAPQQPQSGGQQGSQHNGQAAQSAEEKNETHEETTGTSNDRLFYALPNFLTIENANQLPPLTAGQKFKLQARSQFDYVEIPWYGILAGFSQARNTSPGFGQGAAGYGKRYASEWGDGLIENFMTAAVFTSVLHQDPRYYQSGKGSFWHRFGYALSRVVVTRSDSGQQVFNASQVFGSAVAAGISTYSYHPRDERTLRNTASVWGTQLGLDTFTLGVKEFWPDIHRRFSRKKPGQNSSP